MFFQSVMDTLQTSKEHIQITESSYLYLFQYNVVNGLRWAQKQEKKLFLSSLYRDWLVPRKEREKKELWQSCLQKSLMFTETSII